MSSIGSLVACPVCGGRDLVATEYMTESTAVAPALRCTRCDALHLHEAVARSPEERESVRQAKAERAAVSEGVPVPSGRETARSLLGTGPMPLPELTPGGRVLVVDDEDVVRDVHSTILRRSGWTVVEESDGLLARRRVAKEKFDVILTDLVMPGFSGTELLRAVREQDLDVPVIILTGQPDLLSAMQAVEYGAFRYIAKPVAPKALIEAVGNARNLHRMALFKRRALALLGGSRRALGDRASVEARVSNALETLWMAYQPIVSVGARRIIGYEALLQTHEPTLGYPRDLLDAARRVGREQELARRTRSLIAIDAAKLKDGVLLFVNAQPEDLNDIDFASPSAPLSRFANRVVIEVTERVSLETVGGLQTSIGRLRALGYKLAVDELGVGYAGLSSFTQLQPDYVKLDASLVHNIDQSSEKWSIVQSILQLAVRDLRLEVICEGVETDAERLVLMALGADLLQGSLFARPSLGFAEPTW